MRTSERFSIPPAALPADANVRYQYPIHRGQWIVHPDLTPRENSFCRYFLDFTLTEPATVALHVSADQRFELYCDGEFVGMGPDRSDVEHWSFHSYRVALEAGAHRLSAEVHYLAQNAPFAQTTLEPGFVLYAEDSPVDLNTGSAPWKATRLRGVTTAKSPVKGFFVVGPDYTIDAAEYFNEPPPQSAIVRQPAGADGGAGRIQPGWKLHPSPLPEQLRRPVGGGVIRFVGDLGDADPFPTERPADPAWQTFIEGRAPLAIPPHTRITALWDLQQYHTAFPELRVVGGAGARVQVRWAESCFEKVERAEGSDAWRKGNRDEIAGKYFLGNGDTFLPDGPRRVFRPFWWRSGRYVRISIDTAAEPVTLEQIRLLETRFPLENEGQFASSDSTLDPVIRLAARGIQMCAHETYMDCPYYEQMMYVGDTRLQMLTAYVMSREDRLNRRAIELFDWSRRETGFVLERYPSRPKQLSCTFAMIWILMLRDFAWWRDDADFVRARMKGLRCLLEEFKEMRNAECGIRNGRQTVDGTRKTEGNGLRPQASSAAGACAPSIPPSAFRTPPSSHSSFLLPPLPGWSFMDWVEGLSFVNPPGPDASVSGVVNLLFLNALLAAAELEEHFGEAHLAAYNRAWAEGLAAEIEGTFWDDHRGLFAEDPAHTGYSEHSQCLALLSGLFPDRAERCFASLLTAEDLRRTTVYFSFYLLETFARFGRGDLILRKLDFWKNMAAMGLRTPLEMPEPSRSDCHGWGSHPLFHLHAGIAGIRPASPGFAAVRIAPQPGSLTSLRSVVPHPAGEIALEMERAGRDWRARVALPEGIEGVLRWAGSEYPLRGVAHVRLA